MDHNRPGFSISLCDCPLYTANILWQIAAMFSAAKGFVIPCLTEIFIRKLVLTRVFQLTLTIAPAAIRKSVARSLTVFIFAANSGDGDSSDSRSFKAR